MIELCSYCHKRHDTGNDERFKVCPDVPPDTIVAVSPKVEECYFDQVQEKANGLAQQFENGNLGFSDYYGVLNDKVIE